MLTLLFKDGTFSPPPNLHTCISLVEVYRFGQCLGEKFSPISTFFSLVSSRAFRDAPHSRFWCRDLQLCLLDFLKMLDLVFLKSTHLYFTCESLSIWTLFGLEILDHLYFFLSRVFSCVKRCASIAISVSASQTMLTGLFKDARLGPSLIYTPVFHL